MFTKNSLKLNENLTKILFIRHGHILRGKPPGVARSLEQRLNEENLQDPEITKTINIGFPRLRLSRSVELKQRLAHIKSVRKNLDLEKQARNNSLIIDLEKVKSEYNKSAGHYQLKVIAEHYGIFKDLFGYAYFVPRVPLDIKYQISDEKMSPVFNGNVLKPSEAKNEPIVSFDSTQDLISGKNSKEDSYWTLILTNPDAHFSGEEKEYVHWFKGNILNGDVKNGDTIVPYLQPFPPQGIGFQRFIFILYKQNQKINFNEYKIDKLNDLEKRTFNTFEFYRKYQDEITPAGLGFFQSDWEKSLTDFYHNVLEMKEPTYNYDFPRPYLSDQEWFPLRQPFNLYMDKHRDQKQVHKEYLVKKLAKTHPFDGPEVPLRFPNVHPLKNIPSWIKTEIRKERLQMGRIKDV